MKIEVAVFSKENKNKYYNLINGKPAIDHIFLRWFLGKYWFITGILMPYIIFLLIPWDVLYDVYWYQSYIQWVGNFFPVINNISGSKILFPEYAAAFLAFLNVMGVLLVVAVFIFTLISIELLEESKFLIISFKELVFYYFFLINCFLVVTIFWALFWKVDVEKSRYIPKEILEYEMFFVLISILYWLTVVIFSVGSAFSLKAILVRLSNRFR